MKTDIYVPSCGGAECVVSTLVEGWVSAVVLTCIYPEGQIEMLFAPTSESRCYGLPPVSVLDDGYY